MATIDIRTPNLDRIKVGELQAKLSVDRSRVLRYSIDFWHHDLSLHKELSATEVYLLQSKVNELMTAWDRKLAELKLKTALLEGKELAEELTAEASERLESISTILPKGLDTDSRIDWEAIKDKTPFSAPINFPKPRPPRRSEPKPTHFPPSLSFIDTLLGRRAKKIAQNEALYQADLGAWRDADARNELKYQQDMSGWTKEKEDFDADYFRRRNDYLAQQSIAHATIHALAQGVAEGEAEAVLKHATLVLERSDYADLFEKSIRLEYQSADKTLMLEYSLPSPDNIPTLKSVRFVTVTGEYKEGHISEREKKSNYDAICYQICLRTIHELFQADECFNIDYILFNGTTNYIDRSTGQDTRACIMSILVNRTRFTEIDLSRVDPRVCFKSLKGVSASSLAALAPIPPVMELDKDDDRFIEGRETARHLNEATNLASMNWEDFEHLVREIFEKEYASRSGTVKITQASSDGGVDAVIFDEDLLHGGKFVVQAKRYTNTVGVAAVRELFGTMQHEHASRGILITTSDYGSDAYEFAAGKQISLLNGGHLLHMLERHGYKAKIDIREARKELNLRERE